MTNPQKEPAQEPCDSPVEEQEAKQDSFAVASKDDKTQEDKKLLKANQKQDAKTDDSNEAKDKSGDCC
jgi:hypothetical protein